MFIGYRFRRLDTSSVPREIARDELIEPEEQQAVVVAVRLLEAGPRAVPRPVPEHRVKVAQPCRPLELVVELESGELVLAVHEGIDTGGQIPGRARRGACENDSGGRHLGRYSNP